LIVVVVGAVTGYGYYRLGQVPSVPSGNSVLGAPKAGAPENILLIGSTSRCAAAKLAVFASECAAQVDGVNSDVVMIVHFVPKTKRVTLLSIPRDTFVPDARSGGLYNKVDAALADGAPQLATAITQDFGIPINHFIELNFDTFTNVVDALGGIKLYFPDRLYDASNPPLSIRHTGCIYLSGYQSLALVRSRHLYYFAKGEKINYKAIQEATADQTYYTPDSGGSYDGSGDLGRITRVHTFLHVLATAVAKRGIGNPFTDNSLAGAIAPNLIVDSKLGGNKTEMLDLALALQGADLGTAPELTAPIVVDAATYYYKGYNYGLVVFPTEPQDQATIDRFIGAKPDGLKLSPSSISVSVVDGTGSPSATATTAAQLRALGYPIVATTATNYVGPVSETSVVYAAGHLQEAERVLASLSGTVVMAEGTPASGADVSVIAGSDLTVQPPATSSAPPPTTTAPTPASSPTTTTPTTPSTTVTTTTNPNFGAPTDASPPLSPWDPRACPTALAK
jgi:LCP family protein required for cell wall assembly